MDIQSPSTTTEIVRIVFYSSEKMAGTIATVGGNIWTIVVMSVRAGF
jgi:hypothetical protein